VFTCGFEGEVLQWEMLEVRGHDAVGASLKCNLLGRTKAHRAEILCCVFVPPHAHSTRHREGLLLTAGNDLTIRKWAVSDRAELELAGHMQLLTPDGEVGAPSRALVRARGALVVAVGVAIVVGSAP
jgi:hypothetical protein